MCVAPRTLDNQTSRTCRVSRPRTFRSLRVQVLEKVLECDRTPTDRRTAADSGSGGETRIDGTTVCARNHLSTDAELKLTVWNGLMVLHESLSPWAAKLNYIRLTTVAIWSARTCLKRGSGTRVRPYKIRG